MERVRFRGSSDFWLFLECGHYAREAVYVENQCEICRREIAEEMELMRREREENERRAAKARKKHEREERSRRVEEARERRRQATLTQRKAKLAEEKAETEATKQRRVTIRGFWWRDKFRETP
jgi:hypothetical protein